MPVFCSPVQGYPIAVKQMHAPANAVRGLGGCGPEVSVWVCALLRRVRKGAGDYILSLD